MNEKLMAMAWNFIAKKGLVYEAKNTDLEFEAPSGDRTMLIRCKIEHMTITVKE